MFILIDNYDSFTYNLYHYLLELGTEVEVYRNDKITVSEIEAKKPQGIIISPGPCTPNDAGICLELIEKLHKTIPLFGVCLGHQAICQVFGAEIIRGEKPMHAVISNILVLNHDGIFKAIPPSFKATRYHSLIAKRETMPDCLEITAESYDLVVQSVQHKEFPVFGVQFHPESIASEYGHQMLKNFIHISK